MEGGKEQNFWPGFVDALANVVLVMIFVVVVFVVTLFYYSQKLAEYKAQKFVEKRDTSEQIMHPATGGARDVANSLTPQQLSNAPKPGEDSKDQQIAALKTQVASLRVQMAGQSNAAAPGSIHSEREAPNRIIEVKATERDKQTETGVRVESSVQAIVLHFDEDATTLDAAAAKGLGSSVGPWVERLKNGTGKIVVSGAVGTLGYTEGRRRAFYRTIAVRNQLIEMGVPPARVISRVVPGEDTADSGSRVVLQYTTQDLK